MASFLKRFRLVFPVSQYQSVALDATAAHVFTKVKATLHSLPPLLTHCSMALPVATSSEALLNAQPVLLGFPVTNAPPTPRPLTCITNTVRRKEDRVIGRRTGLLRMRQATP